MRWSYSCPECHAMLNPSEAINLVAVQGETRLLIAFHPEPGNYEIHLPPDVTMAVGSRWDFLCPVCHHDLVTEDQPDLCALDLVSKGTASKVLFSRVAGEQMTFVTAADE